MTLPLTRRQIFVLIVTFLAVHLFAESVLAQLHPMEVVSFTSDGAWCWFQDPRAVHVKGVHERVYAQWMTNKGQLQVGAVDLETGRKEIHTIKENWDIDDHNVGAFLVLKDQRLMTFYARHNKRGIFCRTTSYPEDISEWGEEVLISDADRITYAHPVYLSEEERFYVFWRGYSWKPTFSTSRDGKTWSTPQIVIQDEGREEQDIRPYTKITSDGVSSIHIAFTDGHPNREPYNSVYYLKYEHGQFFKADGTVVANLNSLPVKHKSSDVVYDARSGGARAWVWDIQLDQDGTPTVAYASFTHESDHRYYFARSNGKRWISTELTNAGTWFPQTPAGEEEREVYYSGGIAIDPSNTTTLYLSRKVNGTFELEQWKSADRGNSWEMTSLTAASSSLNVRPVVPFGLPKGKEIVLWMSGDYRHYTSYKTGINLMLLSK